MIERRVGRARAGISRGGDGVDFVFVGSIRLRERFVFEVKVHRLSFHSRVTRFAALFPTLAARAPSPEGSPAGTPAGPRDDSQLFFTPRFFSGTRPGSSSCRHPRSRHSTASHRSEETGSLLTEDLTRGDDVREGAPGGDVDDGETGGVAGHDAGALSLGHGVGICAGGEGRGAEGSQSRGRSEEEGGYASGESERGRGGNGSPRPPSAPA